MEVELTIRCRIEHTHGAEYDNAHTAMAIGRSVAAEITPGAYGGDVGGFGRMVGTVTEFRCIGAVVER